MVLLVWSFRSALFFALSAANPILRDLAHSPLSTLASDDISKANASMQHLKRVHELQLSRNVEYVLAFSHICEHEAHQEFSPSYHLAEVEFSLQLVNMSILSDANAKILNRFRNS